MTSMAMQESIKTKHPQLLYESKLYRVLQGGSMSLTLLSLLVLERDSATSMRRAVQVEFRLSDGLASRVTTTSWSLIF